MRLVNNKLKYTAVIIFIATGFKFKVDFDQSIHNAVEFNLISTSRYLYFLMKDALSSCVDSNS